MSAIHKKYILEIVVFLVGASIMVYELVGSRILAPFMGTSLYVWTGIIGIILGALSIGYWWGGIIADKNPTGKNLAQILFITAIFLLFVIFIKDIFLETLTQKIKSVQMGATLASLVLFAPASILFGMVAPYAVRLKMEHVKNSGKTVGVLYSLSTLGSIAGTFFAGYVLIPTLGTTKILFLIAATLLLCAFLLNPFLKIKKLFHVLFLFFLCSFGAYAWDENVFYPQMTQYDTQYNHIRIYDFVDQNTGKSAQILRTNNEASSAMFLESDDLVFEYTKFYDLGEYFSPHFTSAIMLGGAAYSYPKYFLHRYPNATLDVVEIDPKLTEIAKKHFRLQDNPRLQIFHEDGRIFLKNTKKKYDVFYGDAYKSLYSLPYHLTTQEAAEEIYNSLNKNGVALINIISPINGKGAAFLHAEYNTFARIFPQVFLFPVRDIHNEEKIQNIMLVASKNKTPFHMKSNNTYIQKLLDHTWNTTSYQTGNMILKDNYAPVEYLIEKML